jgi:penicillin-binding protein 1B
MAGLGSITKEEYDRARLAELKVAPLKPDITDAPYLVDFIREELLKDYSQAELLNGNLRVYPTLDPGLQKAAVEAVDKGLSYVAEQFDERDKHAVHPEKRPQPQAGLIAIDPHSGEIRAMVGGSNYAATQYNRITQAFRQPGSIFKPFVYAAAFETAYDDPKLENQVPLVEPGELDLQPPGPAEAAEDSGNQRTQSLGEGCITPVTTVMDEPTVFVYEDGRTYEPANYKQKYRGLVTIRTVLLSSLNVPTIKVAEQIGYDRVAKLAMRMGLNSRIKGFPSVALGAFEVTPIELAGAYTAFANEGRRIQPHTLLRVAASDGTPQKEYTYEPQEVLRPEIAYMVTHLMEGVIDHGTGANVRMRGFRLPAAGKTGTSRDGWFAGYTKDLLVISWVGFDDNSDLDLEGARSGLPIWTEFMTRAYQLYPVRNVGHMRFKPPPGIEIVSIDADSLMLAGPLCENKYDEAFVSGTAPLAHCPLHTSTIADQEHSGQAQLSRQRGGK